MHKQIMARLGMAPFNHILFNQLCAASEVIRAFLTYVQLYQPQLSYIARIHGL